MCADDLLVIIIGIPFEILGLIGEPLRRTFAEGWEFLNFATKANLGLPLFYFLVALRNCPAINSDILTTFIANAFIIVFNPVSDYCLLFPSRY